MSNLPSDDEIALLKMDINRINLTSTAIEASLGAEDIPSTDILALATQAYQQGKITKDEFMGVINALDEQSNQTNPLSEIPMNEIPYIANDPYLNGSKSITNYSARQLMRALYWTGKKELKQALEPELTHDYGKEKIDELWLAVQQADEALRTLNKYHLMKIIDFYDNCDKADDGEPLNVPQD